MERDAFFVCNPRIPGRSQNPRHAEKQISQNDVDRQKKHALGGRINLGKIGENMQQFRKPYDGTDPDDCASC